jgi:hypothetical protein
MTVESGSNHFGVEAKRGELIVEMLVDCRMYSIGDALAAVVAMCRVGVAEALSLGELALLSDRMLN